jgi:hypothetical protein
MFDFYKPQYILCSRGAAGRVAFQVADLKVCCDCDGQPPVEDWAFELGMDLDED